MNILVCISKTPDTTAKISFKENSTVYDTDGVNFIMNPYDEWYALVRAIELTEQLGGEVEVINVGPATNDIIIRKALATGAHKAVRIDAEPLDAYYTAFQISEYVKGKEIHAIFCGKETIDYNGGEIGSLLSEMLDWPYVALASHLEHDGQSAIITRDIEGGVERCQISGPFVISASKGLAEQRIPNMKGIMMAKSKPLQIISPVAADVKVKTSSFQLPEPKKGVRLIDENDIDTLVQLLHDEAKVI